jgi:hypothetical protein
MIVSQRSHCWPILVAVIGSYPLAGIRNCPEMANRVTERD